MFRNRIILAILTLTMLCAAAAAQSGPSLGTWTFAGKDNAAVDWKGTLTISKLDPDRFSADKYFAVCAVDVQSATTGKGVEAPCRWDAAARSISFSTGVDTQITYTAVLSPDGKTLKGKWTETTKANRRTGEGGGKPVASGDWTAAFTGK